jgi:hypothetical protein
MGRAVWPDCPISIFGEKQVVLSNDKVARDLMVKRGDIYSDRGTPHAMAYITHNLNTALMPRGGMKLQKQVDEVVGSERLPSFEDIPNLPIVRAIVKEGVRYRTIKAELGIPHRLERDDIYEGYFFPKGTVFHANYS